MQPGKSSKAVMDVRRPNNIQAKKTAKSQTLMRKGVKKPIVNKKGKAIIKLRNDDLKKIHSIHQTNQVSRSNLMKDKRAKSVQKSSLISRFNPTTDVKVVSRNIGNKGIDITKVISKSANENLVSPTRDLIEKSISKATAHDQKYLPKKRTALKLSIGFILLVITFFLAINLYNHVYPRLKLATASEFAGFKATTPGYIPSGYTLGKVSVVNSKVTTEYNSNSDIRNFQIIQQPSVWNNDTLIYTFLQPQVGNNYTVVKSTGISVFIYNQNDATWVTGGIWYRISGNPTLSNQELVHLATSM